MPITTGVGVAAVPAPDGTISKMAAMSTPKKTGPGICRMSRVSNSWTSVVTDAQAASGTPRAESALVFPSPTSLARRPPVGSAVPGARARDLALIPRGAEPLETRSVRPDRPHAAEPLAAPDAIVSRPPTRSGFSPFNCPPFIVVSLRSPVGTVACATKAAVPATAAVKTTVATAALGRFNQVRFIGALLVVQAARVGVYG